MPTTPVPTTHLTGRDAWEAEQAQKQIDYQDRVNPNSRDAWERRQANNEPAPEQNYRTEDDIIAEMYPPVPPYRMDLGPSDDALFNESLQFILTEGLGQTGDPLKAFIRKEDLTDPELIKFLNSQVVSVTRPDPAMQPNGVTTDNPPDAPRNLELLSAADANRLGLFGNTLTWDVPDNDIDDIAATEIWVAESQNRSDAVCSINWAGQYSTWEPSSDQGGYVVTAAVTIMESAEKIINALKGESPAAYNAATAYGIGDQVSYECEDENNRRYELFKDEEDLITDSDLSAEELDTEIITNQVDRDFSGASWWTNDGMNAYDETGDLTVTADERGQRCYLPDVRCTMVVGYLYKLTFDVANLVSSFEIWDEDQDQVITTAVVTGTNTYYFVYAGSGSGGISIISNADDSSADFDNFSIKPVKFTSFTRTVPGWNVNTNGEGTAVRDGASCDGTQAGTADLSQIGASFTNAVSYITRIVLEDVLDGTITVKINGTSGTARTANGAYQQTIVAGAAGGLVITASSDFIGKVVDIQVIAESGGTTVTGHNPEDYCPLLWKRVGVLSVGTYLGEDVVGIDGNLVVDGSIQATHIAAESITATQINGTAFGTLTISSGKIILNTTDALEINSGGNIFVNAGADIIMTEHNDDPALFNFGDEHYMGAGAISSHTLFIFPATDNVGQLMIGTSVYTLSQQAYRAITITSSYTTQLQCKYDADDLSTITQLAQNGLAYTNITVRNGGTSKAFIFLVDFYSGGNKVSDCGQSGGAWDDVWADDFRNVADFYHLDDHDDLASIHAIKGSGKYNPINGLEIIDDDTLPKWMLSKHKKDGQSIDLSTGKVTKEWKVGDICLTPDGQPFLSLKLIGSLSMGAIRQLDNKVIALSERVKALEL
jgi:hypothetical protein